MQIPFLGFHPPLLTTSCVMRYVFMKHLGDPSSIYQDDVLWVQTRGQLLIILLFKHIYSFSIVMCYYLNNHNVNHFIVVQCVPFVWIHYFWNLSI